MSDPQVAVLMLAIFVFTILLGFPICFTLMAMAVFFGYYAYYDAERMNSVFDNPIFDLFVNQTYSVISNDVLTAVPLFLFMGYIIERANILDRLFHSLHIAGHRLPGSMAVAALATCALFATATGIVGAVVTLMGLLAFPAMLKARYDTSFSAGVICAGGCLGILIPPSIMLIVYAATTNVSIGRLYAGAILPGFLLAALYMIYVIGRAALNPSLAPKPRAEDIADASFGQMALMLATSFFPLAILILSVLGAILFGLATPAEAASIGVIGGMTLAIAYRLAAISDGQIVPDWPDRRQGRSDDWLYALGMGGAATLVLGLVALFLRALFVQLSGLDAPDEPGFLIRPGLGLLITAALAFILSPRGSASGALNRLQIRSRAMRQVAVFAGQGVLIGFAAGLFYTAIFGVLGLGEHFDDRPFNPYGLEIGTYVGLIGYFAWRVIDRDRLQEAVYLTARTSAMVCWLFVGSWTFASVFSYLGGHEIIKDYIVALDLSPITFLIMAQLIIFFLGWPLEWSEIIIIFVPIFLPMLPIFGIDPLFFGILVALNLQTSFLTPPMAMAAYYLKGVAPPHVQLIEIFKGVMPFLSMVLLAMIVLYTFPELALWLPKVFYGR